MNRCSLLSLIPLLMLCVLLACRPTKFSNNKEDNGNGETEEPSAKYKINLLQLKIKDKERVAIDVEVTKGKALADDVEVKFSIACRAISDAEQTDESETNEEAVDYGKELSLGAATTDGNGVIKHTSDKIFQTIDADDADRQCQVLAITDDGKEHEVGLMTVNAALRLVFELGEELNITTTDAVFDTSECDDPKLLVLQLQTIRGVTLVITDNKSFAKDRRENSYAKIFVINTDKNPQNLSCQLYDNIVSLQNSVYAERSIAKALTFERKNEKMWLKDGDYWRPTRKVCGPAEGGYEPKTRDGAEVDDKDGANGDVAKAPWACIAKGDKLLVYYERGFKLYQITTD